MTVFDLTDNVQYRGCSDNVRNYMDLYCRKNPEYCFECKSNQCNDAWHRNEYKDCVFCDSRKDIRCNIAPNSTDLATRKCKGNCMTTLIEDNQYVMRSCLDDKDLQEHSKCVSNNPDADCISCQDENCNNLVYPEDRLKCYHCDSIESCRKSELQLCTNYNKADKCFAKFSENQIEKMGCVSMLNNNELDEWSSQHQLFTCEGDACNKDIPVIAPESCIKCDSKDDPKCAQNPSEVMSKELCPYSIDKCITKLTNDGHTIRGCLDPTLHNVEECTKTGECNTCNTNDCNNEVIN